MTTSVLLQAHEALYTRGLIVGCLVGVLLGGTIGVFVAALCAAAGRGDDVGPRSDPVEPALLSIEQRYRRQQEAAPDVAVE
jgi:gas vesicle protein